jgi:hypothetical protein
LGCPDFGGVRTPQSLYETQGSPRSTPSVSIEVGVCSASSLPQTSRTSAAAGIRAVAVEVRGSGAADVRKGVSVTASVTASRARRGRVMDV